MKKSQIVVGVLALQGSYSLHRPHIEACGRNYLEVRDRNSLFEADALILPGGESGVMLKLLEISNLIEPICEFAKGKPVWGICAGAILMADKVINPEQASLKLIDAVIERNSYGRQLQSHYAEIAGQIVSFIRAPKILSFGKNAEIKHEIDGSPCWVEQDQHWMTTFHPETAQNFPSIFHRQFIERIRT